VRVTDNELMIHDRAFIEATRHPLFARGVTGQRSCRKEHEVPRDARQRSEQLASHFAGFGAAGTRFLEGLLAANRSGKSQAERVLTLAASYPRVDVVAALERAVRYGAFTLVAMQRILAVRGRPRTPLDVLADDHRTCLERLCDGTPTPPRPTSDYQALLDEAPHDAQATDPEEPPHGAEDGGAEPA
jgi:hypothetical protein